MKGALLGSVDLAMQVVNVVVIITILCIFTVFKILIHIVLKQKARGSALFPFPTSAFKMLPGIELSNGVSVVIVIVIVIVVVIVIVTNKDQCITNLEFKMPTGPLPT